MEHWCGTVTTGATDFRTIWEKELTLVERDKRIQKSFDLLFFREKFDYPKKLSIRK